MKIKLLMCAIFLLFLVACSPPQFVFYSDTLVIVSVEKSNRTARGEFKYTSSDGDGSIVFCSNQKFNVGDKVKICLEKP